MGCDGNGQPRPDKRTPAITARIHSRRCTEAAQQIEEGTPVIVATWRTPPKTTIHCHACAAHFKINEADTTKTPYLKRLQEDARNPAEKKEPPKTPRAARHGVPQEAPTAQRQKSARALSSIPGQKKRGTA